MSTKAQAEETRTYGGWRRARPLGMFGLGFGQTMVVLAAMTVALITVSVSLTALAVVGPVCLIVIVGNVAQWDGVSLAQALVQHFRWVAGSGRGRTSFRGGVMSAKEHAWQLPGVLAPTVLLSVDDGHGGTYGVVWHRRLRTMTVTLRCAAQSTWLADPERRPPGCRTGAAGWPDSVTCRSCDGSRSRWTPRWIPAPGWLTTSLAGWHRTGQRQRCE
nr:SCO6880 family protein [Salinispora arenicola]